MHAAVSMYCLPEAATALSHLQYLPGWHGDEPSTLEGE
jgi:hypothetical protein